MAGDLEETPQKPKVTHDPENYYKMSAPFESAEACNEAIAKFHEELSELRKKHKLRDVLVVIYGTVRYSDGKVAEFMQHSTLGSAANAPIMAAYVFGQEQAISRERINKLISKSKA